MRNSDRGDYSVTFYGLADFEATEEAAKKIFDYDWAGGFYGKFNSVDIDGNEMTIHAVDAHPKVVDRLDGKRIKGMPS